MPVVYFSTVSVLGPPWPVRTCGCSAVRCWATCPAAAERAVKYTVLCVTAQRKEWFRAPARQTALVSLYSSPATEARELTQRCAGEVLASDQ